MTRYRLKGALGLILALCLLAGGALALEPTLDLDEWYDTMARFVTQVGTRHADTEGDAKAVAYLTGEFERIGYSRQDGSLVLQRLSAIPADREEPGWYEGMTNLIAIKPAKNPGAKTIIVSAHYDTAVNTPGAKDNASGVAAMLTLAHAMSSGEAFDNTEIQFIAWAAEEKGEWGSEFYIDSLAQEEKENILAVFNIDLITLDEGATDIALCCNTLGGMTEDGFEEGTPDRAIPNRPSMAIRKAYAEIGGLDINEENITFCIPRHWGDSDHLRFFEAEIDAATICFQGNILEGGSWPRDMHTPEDALRPYDMERTQHALNVICRAVYSLAADHEYGLDMADEW